MSDDSSQDGARRSPPLGKAPDDDDAQAVDLVANSTIAEQGVHSETYLDGIIAVALREGEFKYARFLNKVATEIVRRRKS